MIHLDWFVGTMKKTFGIEVKRGDIGYEAHDFYHEEIDDLLIPAEHLEKLPNPLLIEAISYVPINFVLTVRLLFLPTVFLPNFPSNLNESFRKKTDKYKHVLLTPYMRKPVGISGMLENVKTF